MWYPQDIYSLLEILFGIGRIILVLILAPVVYRIFETIFLWAIKFLLGIIRIKLSVRFQLRPTLYRVFFLGGLMKRFLYFAIAKNRGYEIRSNIFVNGYTTSGRVHVGGNASFMQTVVFGYSPYLLIFLSMFLYSQFTVLEGFFSSLGIENMWSAAITWWIILSIFITGRPQENETIFPVETLIKSHPNIFLMSISIVISSLFLIDSLGRYYVYILATAQIAILLLLEVREHKKERREDTEEDRVIIVPEVGYIG